MKIKRFTIACLCGLCLAAPSLHGADAGRDAETLWNKLPKDSPYYYKIVELIRMNMDIQNFREGGMRDIETADTKIFRSDVLAKWWPLQKMFKPVVWGDFFTGAILLQGASDNERRISALYNPWWDAIFLMRMEFAEGRFVVNAFKIRCGEMFRGEKITLEKPSLEPVVGADGKPLPLVWMDLLAKTSKIFDEKYGHESCLKNKQPFDENDVVVNDFDFVSRNVSGVRAVARLKLMQTMFGDKGITLEMMNWLKVLREATEEQAAKILQGDDLEMFKLLAKLGAEIRGGITPYGYWGTETERQYLFVSGDIPRLVMMVYVHVGKGIEFEWFDLNERDRYLKLLEEKNAAKAKP